VEGEETVSGMVELFTVWVYKTADEGECPYKEGAGRRNGRQG